MKGLVVLAAFAAALSASGVTPKKFTWDVPQAIETIEVPGTVEGQGVPMKLHAVKSKASVPDLMAHFRRAFAAAQLYVPPDDHITQVTGNPLLTALDPATKVNFTVIFQPNPDGTTTVILAEAHLAERRPPAGQFFAPVFPGGEAPVQSRVAEGVQALTYATRASEKDVLKFYRDALKPSGYEEVAAKKFKRGGDELTVHYEVRPGEAARVVVLGRPYVDESLTAP